MSPDLLHLIQADDFTIQNRLPDGKLGQRSREIVEAFIDVVFLGDQIATSIRDVRKCPKAIVLQFKEPFRIIERGRREWGWQAELSESAA